MIYIVSLFFGFISYNNVQTQRIAFLVSGSGGSLKTVAQAIVSLSLPWQICLVVADRSCGALAYARRQGLANALVPYSRQAPDLLQAALQQSQPDLVVMAFDKIIDQETLALFPDRFINVHYSLLPAFKGLIGMKTLEQAQCLNVGVVGATCHEVEEAVDNGRILSQCGLAVDWRTESLPQIADWVFRGAGLVLLEAIHQKISPTIGITPTINYHGKTLFFAPALSFVPTGLDEDFWLLVKDN